MYQFQESEEDNKFAEFSKRQTWIYVDRQKGVRLIEQKGTMRKRLW